MKGNYSLNYSLNLDTNFICKVSKQFHLKTKHTIFASINPSKLSLRRRGKTEKPNSIIGVYFQKGPLILNDRLFHVFFIYP